ncbi:SDR family NAD(P)-dependent oxidoreductase [Streptomyces sp. TRM72054]|uniref:SDR family NAD(P)-dependent oxidoreductase n=1 Tax=Streptomyces sp. TRM72054 TaxID=2870562 RepID=UPI001C8C99B5|nr:SDR family NAD(P)-dependent oxidoreductase [Streptomyces sp. TRM72054]MBX9394626.1 SDR family NAD(P)-dependent oxidoreductase [Streptomyces sp. TRM72054]
MRTPDVRDPVAVPFGPPRHDAGRAPKRVALVTALITGASSGRGAAHARLLAADCDFVLVARRADRLSELADELRAAGAAVEVLPADLGNHDGLATVAKRIAAGDVRLLISNAGDGGYAPLADGAPEEIDRLLTLNGVASIQLARAALPGMLTAGEGTIVTVASLLAFSAGQSNPHMPPRTLYNAAKAATVAFTRTLTHERRIRKEHPLRHDRGRRGPSRPRRPAPGRDDLRIAHSIAMTCVIPPADAAKAHDLLARSWGGNGGWVCGGWRVGPRMVRILRGPKSGHGPDPSSAYPSVRRG